MLKHIAISALITITAQAAIAADDNTSNAQQNGTTSVSQETARYVITRVRGSEPVANEFGLTASRTNRIFEVVELTPAQAEHLVPHIKRHERVRAVEADIETGEPQATKTPFDPNSDPNYYNQRGWIDWTPELAGRHSIERAYQRSQLNRVLNVAIIDSQFGAHPDLIYSDGINLHWTAESEQQQRNYLLYDTDCATDSRRTFHGAEVMSIMSSLHNNGIGNKGIIPDALYTAVNVSNTCRNSQGFGISMASVAEGILWATGDQGDATYAAQHKADIINISLGTTTPVLTCPAYMQEAIDHAVENGAIITVSAGNSPSLDAGEKLMGVCDGLVVVAAVDGIGEPAPFTSKGSRVSFSALGYQATAGFNERGSGNSAGTSYAAPVVAGIMGLLWQTYPDLNRDDVLLIAERSTTPVPGDATGMGIGILNANLMFDTAEAIKDATNFLVQHPERLGGIERGLAAFIDSKAPGANACGLIEVDASASLRESQQYAVLFRVPEGQPLRNENGTVVAAQRQDRFLVPGTSLQVAGQYGLQVCNDAQGQNCLIGPLVPVNPALAGQGFGC
ncbi:MAG: S8 family serine peptidase [Marinobacter sp.]|nr:S8 family serine peptidase [Marinobacter sp.]